MTTQDSQYFDSYIPVYDAVPESWQDARPFLVEQLKKISNEINNREIGWFLDQELLSGKFLFPGQNSSAEGGTSEKFRTIFRKVIEFSTINAGINSQAHGINIDSNFTLVSLWGAVTNAVALTGQPIPNGSDTIRYTSTNIIITTAAAWTRGLAIIEYVQEL